MQLSVTLRISLFLAVVSDKTQKHSWFCVSLRYSIRKNNYFCRRFKKKTPFFIVRFQTIVKFYIYLTVHHCDSWGIKDQLDVTCYFFHFLCAQHVSGINISFIRSLRLFCWITTLVVLFLVRCVLEFRCGWVGVISVLQAEACNTDTTPIQPHRNIHTKFCSLQYLMFEHILTGRCMFIGW